MPGRNMIRSCACESDPLVFGHSACSLAPAWLVSFGLWACHISAEGRSRQEWLTQARKELEHA